MSGIGAAQGGQAELLLVAVELFGWVDDWLPCSKVDEKFLAAG